MNIQRSMKEDTITFFSGNKEIFWMKEEQDGVQISVTLGGELISETVFEFQDEMLALVSVGADIALHMKEVRYIAAAYMQALLNIQLAVDKRGSGSFCLTDISEAVLKELKQTGTYELLSIK